jgi:hypothetical protein
MYTAMQRYLDRALLRYVRMQSAALHSLPYATHASSALADSVRLARCCAVGATQVLPAYLH